ncbi:unnamed protein product [Mytilus coruscus]|uniref:Inter-alpha-trypsin inhibitor heavy chain H4 n=1 Tax=Mytilus coruscus TaxID=42192 RepID=A0A6J8DF76_MYTCO|nr:unnamed protein product [Mytilus coruscus]
MDARFTCLVFLLFTVVNSKSNNLEITSLHVQSDIRYRFATTLVTSTVANNDNKSVEAKFDVTLPDAAFITEFVMEIDGQLYPGEINEKEKAKKKYETAKKKGQTAGIVSQKPRHTNRFSVDVNVAAESSVTFNLTYQELLERVYGEYEHIIYIDPGQIVEDFKIDVAIHESRDITKVSVPPIRNDIISDSSIDEGKNALVTIDRPTTKSAMIHYEPTIDDQKQQSDQGISGLFVIEYDVERKFDGGEVLVVDGYFVHFFAPSGMKPIPKDILFILDVSGSMAGVKIQQQSDAMEKILQDLNEDDRFNILEFSSHSKLWQGSLVSVNSNTIRNAREFIQERKEYGGTRANDALEKGIQFLNNVELDSQRIKLIVFMTDGRAETSSNTILKNVKTYNTKGITMFSLAFGNNADYTFIKKLAVQNKGIARRIFEDSDSSLQIKGFYDEISCATLQNLTFKYLGKDDEVVENVTRQNFDTFFDGKELIIAGKMSDDEVNEVDLVVTGDGSDGHVELSLDSDANKGVPELTKPEDFHKITERIWAYLTIKQLLESAIEVDNAEEKTQLNQRALDLSLKYKFVTPLTSMVVTKPDEKDVGSFEENEDAQLALSSGSLLGSSSKKHIMKKRVRRPIRHRGPSGGSYSGGAGGDPHFMVRMKDLELPVCFNIKAKNGEILQLLKDPVSGVTINAGVVESTARNEHGDLKTFFGELVLSAPSVEIVVKPSSIYFNGAFLSWNDKNVFRMENVAIIVKYVGRHDRTMTIDFGNDIIVTIRRHMKQDTNMAMSYLNIYIEKETGISQFASGVLGELVHKSTKLFQITLDNQGNEHGHFLEVGDGHAYRFFTNLGQKQNVITGEDTTCWIVPQPMEGLLDENISNNNRNIVLGDFNCALIKNLDRKPVPFRDDIGSLELKTFIEHNELIDVWRKRYPKDKQYTFCRGNSRSRIDYIFISSELQYKSQQNLEITSLHVQSDIRYRFATTLVTSTVENTDNKSVEAKFDVTLPDAAFITEFVMEIDGKLYPGEINEKEKAKKKYETAKKKGQTAGIVSQKPRHTNRFSVDANIAAESTVTFNLTYQELLERVYGEYEHIIYIEPGQIVEDFKIDVVIHESRDITKVSVPPIRNDIISDSSIDEGKNGLVTINRPTTKSAMIHYGPTTDDQKQESDQGISGLFVIEYDVERKFDGGEVLVVDGYFVHFFGTVWYETDS